MSVGILNPAAIFDRWLEYDGDGRTARDAGAGEAFTCDAVGCIAHVKGTTVAVARHPAAVTDDCLNADVLVLDMPKPDDCAVPLKIPRSLESASPTEIPFAPRS